MPQTVILLVEDEALVGLELREMLEGYGYIVPPPVVRGEDVPEAIIVHNPDLIIMDIRLKGYQDGIETAFMIGGEFDVPFIFLSAYSDEQTLARALGTKAYGYLVKPFEERTLRTTIELALRRAEDFKRREQETWYRSILDGFPRPVFVTDAYGRITFANIVARARMGTGADSGTRSDNAAADGAASGGVSGGISGGGTAGAVGSALHLLFDKPAQVTEFLEELATSTAKSPAASRILRLKNGTEIQLEASMLRDEEGRPGGYTFLFPG